MSRKLAQRGYEPESIRETLDRLQSERLLDEGRYVEAYVHSRIERGYGPVRIRAELEGRGVDAALIGHYLDAVDEDWLAAAREQYRKRYGGGTPSDYRERVKRAQFLQRHGYTAEVAKDVVGGW